MKSTNKDNELRLKVAEAMQEDVNKGIVRIDHKLLRELQLREGDILEIEGGRKTIGIVDRALPGDYGLDIIRMDGILRRNSKSSLGETVTARKTEFKEASKVTLAPARQGVMIRAPPEMFKQGLLGRAAIKGDIISFGGTRTRRKTLSGNPFFDDIFSSVFEDAFNVGFGFGDLKFIVTDTNPKGPIIITENTEITVNPEAVELEKESELPDVTYEDIGGLDEEIKKIREMVELPLKHPEIFERLGIEPPKGVLLHGPPGTGKTLLAKAVASETNANFILINGPEIMSKYYGQSEENLRKKFEEAEANAPSIIFIDEIDAIASKREEVQGEVEKRVVAQLLGVMDGLKSRGKVVVIAATNIPNSLDPALRRPGRFDREVEIGVPGKAGRLKILKIHTRNMPLLGTIYSDILEKNILPQIEEKKEELNEKIKEKHNEIDETRDEIKQLENEIKQLERERKSANQSMIARIFSKIKNIDSEIQKLNKKHKSLEEDLEIKKKIITELDEIKDKLSNEEKEFKKLVLEMKEIEEARRKYSPEDPRTRVVENEAGEIYKRLKQLEIVASTIDKTSQEGISRDLEQVSEITHGFVGADLSALAKEAAMIVIRRVIPDFQLKGDNSLSKEILEKLIIGREDFNDALRVVRPSAMREVLVEIPNVRWHDIGGLEDTKKELIEAVEWPLNNPEAFTRLGVKPPKGVLLYGPPGTGKTMLAKAVANESKANFISIKGPELISKWVGESEKAIRKIFEKARQTSPTIIFFDEIDSIAPKRGASADSRTTEQVVNQLLTEMDGLVEMKDVVVIAATNRPDIVDPALLRPGRFDRLSLVQIPDEKMREQIFKVHTKGMPLKNVNIKQLAEKTEGYVGADIESICKEAAIMALRKNMDAKEVTQADFDEASQKVKASVDVETKMNYEKIEGELRSAKAREMKQKVSYFG